MSPDEAREWLNGNRSMTNLIPESPFDTWQVRIAQADAAMMQQAVAILSYHEKTYPAAEVELLVEAIKSEPMPTGEPAESVWLGRQQVADELSAALRGEP